MEASGTVEKLHTDFATQGPWAVLTLILILAIGYAAWKIYNRLSNSLDNSTKALVDTTEKHADKLETINERSIKAIENNTEVMKELSTGRIDMKQVLKSRKKDE